MSVDPEQQPENPLEPDQPPAPDAEPEPENPDAEPVEPIEPPDEEPEPEQEAPPVEPSSYAVTEEQGKQLASEVKRHTTKVGAILGDVATDVIVCPFCNPDLQGFLYPGDLQHPRDEIHAKMIEVLAPKPSIDYLQASNIIQCESCEGYGKVRTGSKVPGNDLVACRRCLGYGYIPPPTGGQNGVVESEEVPSLVTAGGGEQILEDVDVWGSPRLLADGMENPNYGKMPQYKRHDLP